MNDLHFFLSPCGNQFHKHAFQQHLIQKLQIQNLVNKTKTKV